VSEVVVIGGGAAGAAAGLAASWAGARVTVLSRAQGATALSSGALDLAGSGCERPTDPWRGRPATRQLYEELLHGDRRHPLGIAGVDAALAEQILRRLDIYKIDSLDREPLVLPTDLGTFKSTTACQPGAAAAHLPALAGQRIGVVGITGYPAFDCERLAAGYRHHAARGGVELETVPVRVDLLTRRGDEQMHPGELAAEIERAPTRERLAGALARLAEKHGLTFLLLPPVMGLERSVELPDPPPMAEILAGPPSVPGLRLQRSLDAALEQAGATLLRRGAAGHRTEGRQVRALQLESGQPLEADVFVLATGKFIGRGLVHDPVLREPLFGLPVWIDDAGPDLTYLGKHVDRRAGGPHPLLRAGLRVEEELRPLANGGRPARDNLFAAGSVIGGYDYVRDRCGLGTALITGFCAGARAAGADPAEVAR
jgi:glycerol-3-phosphate dehydrogenase subunit B